MQITSSGAVTIPCLIKAVTTPDGRRMITVQASSQDRDTEGDVVTQRSLLDSADSFLRSGHIDIEHLSEIGDRLGVARPTDFIIGIPVGVVDEGSYQTDVEALLHAGREKADEVWESLNATPAVRWRASIYGFPTELIDARKEPNHKLVKAYGATRYLVLGIRWASLALCRHPINQSVSRYARVTSTAQRERDVADTRRAA